jgi:hypothetical protein
MRPNYIYILIEEGEDPSVVKIGHSVDPLNRPKGYQAGNPRNLLVLFTLIGGQPLEKEIHFRFSENKIDRGGDEWFRLSPELIEFLQFRLKYTLTNDLVLAYNQPNFSGPIRIQPVVPGAPETRPVSPVQNREPIRPVSIAEAEPLESPYSKVGQKRTIK